jgi:hypothetical protein
VPFSTDSLDPIFLREKRNTLFGPEGQLSVHIGPHTDATAIAFGLVLVIYDRDHHVIAL